MKKIQNLEPYSDVVEYIQSKNLDTNKHWNATYQFNVINVNILKNKYASRFDGIEWRLMCVLYILLLIFIDEVI